MKKGDTLVIVEKSCNPNECLYDWNKPFEFILLKQDKILKCNPSDYNDVFEMPVLVGVDGTTLEIDNSFGVPIVDNYDIYLNFQSYFDKIDKSTQEAIKNIKIEAEYIKSYQTFKKKIIQDYPEKLI
jgi:hypothetical protein